jgi:hypothetical protein
MVFWFDQIGARTHGLLQSRLTITPPMRFSAVRDKDFLELLQENVFKNKWFYMKYFSAERLLTRNGAYYY